MLPSYKFQIITFNLKQTKLAQGKNGQHVDRGVLAGQSHLILSELEFLEITMFLEQKLRNQSDIQSVDLFLEITTFYDCISAVVDCKFLMNQKSIKKPD